MAENKLSARLVSAYGSAKRRFRVIQNRMQNRLEAQFDKAIENGGFTYFHSLNTNFLALLCAFISIEFILMNIGMFGILSASGAFMMNSPNTLISPFVFWPVILLLVIVLSFFSWLVLGPLHGMFKVRLWKVSVLYIILSSVLFSGSILLAWPYINTDPPMPFFSFLSRILVLFSLGTAFVIVPNYRRTSFWHYRQNISDNALELIIPAAIRGSIISVSAQDHYVLITTKKGTHLHRMGLAEALGKLPENDGIQVHRSHWVAISAMRKLDKKGNRHFVSLQNGDAIPVSAGKLDKISALLP